jgi:hypothetical protein
VSDAYLASVVQDWAKADDRISKLQDKLDTCFDQNMKTSIRKCIAALHKSFSDRLATLSPRDEQRCWELHAASNTARQPRTDRAGWFERTTRTHS